jgi:transposase
MTKMSVLGIDLAKNVFQLHGTDEKGRIVLQKRLSRAKLSDFICKIPPCLIGMEACGGAHYWARKFQSFGHEVKLMSPQYVKPYVKTNKNDMNDAEAICEAVTRPSMRFVPIKTIEQQDSQAVHRIRSRLMAQRTALANQIRGLLAEYGIVVAQGISRLRNGLPTLIEDNCNKLTPLMRTLCWDLYEQFKFLDKQIALYDHKIKQLCKESESCQRLLQVEGVGPLTASALVAAIGDGKIFQKARQLSAFLGLVPRQSSSGGKQVLLGISKRGNTYIRSLLIHGARAVLKRASSKTTKLSLWLKRLVQRRGYNKACVALANKNARIIWALLTKGTTYKRQA